MVRWTLFILLLSVPAAGYSSVCPKKYEGFATLSGKPYVGLRGLRAKASKIDEQDLRCLRPSGVDAEGLRKSILEKWTDPSLGVEKKIGGTFLKYLESRSAQLDPEKQKQATRALAQITRLRGEKGDYLISDGQIRIGDAFTDDWLTYYSIVVHELEHLTQYAGINTQSKVMESMTFALEEMIQKGLAFPKGPVTKLQAEGEAIGAQWDFLQAIPKEIRRQAWEKLGRNPRLSRRARKGFQAELEMSTLPRDEYIKIVLQEHGYGAYDVLWGGRILGLTVGGAIALWILRIQKTGAASR